MRRLGLFGFLTAAMVMASSQAYAAEDNRIYGKILTVDGDTFEGLIRWDKNEGNWFDVMDGTKEFSSDQLDRRKESRKTYKRGRGIKLFGIRIIDDNSFRWFGSASSGIRFGHIKSAEFIDDDRVLLTLKSGRTVELSGGSTDIGNDIREIVIEDADEGEVEFVWDDIERIDFMSGGKAQASSFGQRLYGTMTTRRGEEFTGFVCWDIDEIFGIDILDGNQKNRKRKIKFNRIASISRYSSSGATLVLKNGDEFVLKGSNDVDDGNRGIIISDLAFGQVRVDWDQFDNLVFKDPPREGNYDSFDGGHLLKGTVYTQDGDSYSGTIRWDDDEEYSWELLDGDYRGVVYDIEFGLITAIEKKSRRRVIVTVSDGRTFRLGGSNDVNDQNKGIFITTEDGEEVEVDWDDFERVEFSYR